MYRCFLFFRQSILFDHFWSAFSVPTYFQYARDPGCGKILTGSRGKKCTGSGSATLFMTLLLKEQKSN
jgi:hypothetical protein